jgi:hypothetical protein
MNFLIIFYIVLLHNEYVGNPSVEDLNLNAGKEVSRRFLEGVMLIFIETMFPAELKCISDITGILTISILADQNLKLQSIKWLLQAIMVAKVSLPQTNSNLQRHQTGSR